MARVRGLYNYDHEKVRRRLQTALRSSAREASQADLISRTGLPKYQIEQTLSAMLDEQRGQLKIWVVSMLVGYFVLSTSPHVWSGSLSVSGCTRAPARNAEGGRGRFTNLYLPLYSVKKILIGDGSSISEKPLYATYNQAEE